MHAHAVTNPGAALLACMQRIAAAGLSQGSSGNASVRSAKGFWITPTGMAPQRMRADDAVEIDPGGRVLAGTLRPSSEWPMHAAIYRARPDAQAIVHCHSRHATALACCGRDIPAFHYMVAVAGGDSIRCSLSAIGRRHSACRDRLPETQRSHSKLPRPAARRRGSPGQ